eukprot:CAMPEP_0204899348 /NCGR_PEP_ID=MMETSP1397-20131031/1802_1 /ASSEMBLY_ACC=CAM_ASM_000891 /TAXON_ID=49980 /ORGANISM="Climacostomum Climacostomum virens, Strain Stock W-24" /LENGTH=414 /DNA_ID=CAMNT_0052067299 /DNA_START=201 /DNA_END=1445 /DNA_ORIENTATION=+
MQEGVIVKWFKKEGEAAKPGEILFEVETDKATVGYEVQEDIVLAKILAQEGGAALAVGQPVAIIVDDAADVAAFSNYTEAQGSAPPAKEPSKQEAPAAPEKAATKTVEPQNEKPSKAKADGDRVFASPLAKLLSAELNVNLNSLTGTGPHNRIVKADVIEAHEKSVQEAKKTTVKEESKAPQVPASVTYRDVPHSQIRKVIASRLQEAKSTIPHFYLSADVEMDALLKLRTQLNTSGELKITINDFVVKCAALACTKVPEANASWQADSIRVFDSVDMSVAVQTDRGLITPIIKGAHRLGLSEISKTTKALSEKAKAGTLKPDEFQGGTFTISNLGMFGTKEFSAIINPPQACILAVGKSEQRVLPADNERGFRVATVMSVTLSCDHRVVDGAIGANWLKAFKGFAEAPYTLLL